MQSLPNTFLDSIYKMDYFHGLAPLRVNERPEKTFKPKEDPFYTSRGFFSHSMELLQLSRFRIIVSQSVGIILLQPTQRLEPQLRITACVIYQICTFFRLRKSSCTLFKTSCRKPDWPHSVPVQKQFVARSKKIHKLLDPRIKHINLSSPFVM